MMRFNAFHFFLDFIENQPQGQIDLDFTEEDSVVTIEIADLCSPVNAGALSYILKRGSSIYDPSPTSETTIVDEELAYFDGYTAGATYSFCVQYVASSEFPEYQFLEGNDHCATYTVPWIAEITGSVNTERTYSGVEAGVPDINVCVYEYTSSTGEIGTTSLHCTTTEIDGTYALEIYQFWPEHKKELVVLPSKGSHVFITSDYLEPNKRVISLSYRGSRSVDFIDLSSVTVSGSVMVLDSTCGVGGVSIIDEDTGETLGTTDDDGSFSFAVSIGKNPLIYFVLYQDDGVTDGGHTFDPSSIQLPVLEDDYWIASTIRDITTREITVSSINGGACNHPVATGKFSYFVRDCSFEFGSVGLPSVSLLRSTTVEIPAQRVKLYLDNTNLEVAEGIDVVDVADFLEKSGQSEQSFDLRYEATGSSGYTYELVYFSPPVLELQALPFTVNQVSGCTAAHLGVDAVVNKGELSTIKYRVYEEYGSIQCFSTNGTASVINYASNEDEPIEENGGLDGSAEYEHDFTPGNPNIAMPYYRTLEIRVSLDLTVGEETQSRTTSRVLKIAILGSLDAEDTFIASTSGLPILILRDPPGGGSFVEFTKGSTLSTSLSFNRESTGGWGIESSLLVGTKNRALTGFGFMTEVSKLEFFIGYEAEMGASITRAHGDTVEFEVSAEETIRTSEAIGLVGGLGDVIAGYALIAEVGTTQILKVVSDSDTTCSFALNEQVSLGNLTGDKDTFFIYTHNFIENSLIPNIETAALLAGDEDEENLDQTAAHWKYILAFKYEKYIEAVSPFTSENNTFKMTLDDMLSEYELFGDYHHFVDLANVEGLTFAAIVQIGVSQAFNTYGLVTYAVLEGVWRSLTRKVLEEADYQKMVEKKGEFQDNLEELIENFREDFNTIKSAVTSISFDGGAGELEQVFSSSRGSSSSMELGLNRQVELGLNKAEHELTIFSVGVKGETEIAMEGEASYGEGHDYTEERTNQVVIHLSDPNPADSFVVEIFEDSYYGVPVFRISESSSTSCLHENGTHQLEQPQITLLSESYQEDVPASEPATFEVNLANLVGVCFHFFQKKKKKNKQTKPKTIA